MNADRQLRIWRSLVDRAGVHLPGISDLCALARALVGVDGAGIPLPLGAPPRDPLCANGPLAVELEELALALGEGPTVDATAGTVTLVGDLLTAEALARWPLFAPAAAAIGV